ncbi:MAG: FAD-binding oxidoreductase [Pseudomonadota bacterium]|nr:FAD-binding oxidoreductase [Pseudomonadota bacterium]
MDGIRRRPPGTPPRHDVIVLGAGMVGVSAGLALQGRGRAVLIVDRISAGRETSYGNAGIIQSEAVEPYAMPRDSRVLAGMVLGRSNDVRYRLSSMPGHLGPLRRYWHHSAPARYGAAVDGHSSLIAHAAAEHDVLIEWAGCETLVRREGYRVFHRTQAALDAAAADASRLQDRFGVAYRIMTPADLRAAEPALRDGGSGAIHWTQPYTVRDPGALVEAYAALFIKSGGGLVTGDAGSLVRKGAGWQVATADGPAEAAAVVVCLGPWTTQFMRGFGSQFPMVRKRGYHAHYASDAGLNLPMLDPVFGYLMAPMVRGTRITTGAELTGPDSPPTLIQLREAERAARTLLNLGSVVPDDVWVGTRPCMPDMRPVIGPASGHDGLWLNFGHGHQGLTLGPASGRLLADLMTGAPPLVNPAHFAPNRYD